MIPCKPQSDQTVDLIVPKGTLQESLDIMTNINTAIQILNMVDPNPISRIALGMVTKVIGIKLFNAKNSDVNEREALYNLKVEVLDDDVFYGDQRIRTDQCGAFTMNMV